MRKMLAILTALFTAKAAQSLEVKVVAAVLWAEARGEGPNGVRAVAEVIRNRTSSPRRWGRTPYEVVTKVKQFACLNGTAPAALVERMENSTGIDATAREVCMNVARGLVEQTFQGEDTGGATHYDCVRQMGWGLALSAIIGNHYFYR